MGTEAASVTKVRRLRSHARDRRDAIFRHSAVRKPVIHPEHFQSQSEAALRLAGRRNHAGEFMTGDRTRALSPDLYQTPDTSAVPWV